MTGCISVYCLAVWLSCCSAIWLSVCLDLWLYGCLVVWLSSCVAIFLSGCFFLSGCLDFWLSSCLAVWLSFSLAVGQSGIMAKVNARISKMFATVLQPLQCFCAPVKIQQGLLILFSQCSGGDRSVTKMHKQGV